MEYGENGWKSPLNSKWRTSCCDFHNAIIDFSVWLVTIHLGSDFRVNGSNGNLGAVFQVALLSHFATPFFKYSRIRQFSPLSNFLQSFPTFWACLSPQKVPQRAWIIIRRRNGPISIGPLTFGARALINPKIRKQWLFSKLLQKIIYLVCWRSLIFKVQNKGLPKSFEFCDFCVQTFQYLCFQCGCPPVASCCGAGIGDQGGGMVETRSSLISIG